MATTKNEEPLVSPENTNLPYDRLGQRGENSWKKRLENVENACWRMGRLSSREEERLRTSSQEYKRGWYYFFVTKDKEERETKKKQEESKRKRKKEEKRERKGEKDKRRLEKSRWEASRVSALLLKNNFPLVAIFAQRSSNQQWLMCWGKWKKRVSREKADRFESSDLF